ncbi:hypothetical protein [Vibrio cyclitrophicus]|uniref:Uncharacterized protein n=1 Tax=Vibrio cyclitrophicus TaxID=47951 RepID=A0ACD5G371_9VIBR
MSSFGFEFETIDSRKFRLDDIQPFLFVGSYVLNNWGATTIQFPQYAGIANLTATLDYHSDALTWTFELRPLDWRTNHNKDKPLEL